MSRGIFVTTLGVMALLIGWETRAEIRVVTDRNGDYRETRILMPETLSIAAGESNVWAPVGRVAKPATLNPDGVAVGDLWPTIAEPKGSTHRAWAVWSRIDELDFDLAWSRWSEGGWESIEWISPGSEDVGDDLDPFVIVDSNGRPFVVWWRDEGDHGRVYLSLFLVSKWMTAYPVSELEVDSRYPSIEILPESTIEVTYETPDGVVVHHILFDDPVTITDDIDPLDHLSNGRLQYVEDATP